MIFRSGVLVSSRACQHRRRPIRRHLRRRPTHLCPPSQKVHESMFVRLRSTIPRRSFGWHRGKACCVDRAHDGTAVRDVATCILYKRRARTAPRSHSVGFMRIGAYGCVQNAYGCVQIALVLFALVDRAACLYVCGIQLVAGVLRVGGPRVSDLWRDFTARCDVTNIEYRTYVLRCDRHCSSETSHP